MIALRQLGARAQQSGSSVLLRSFSAVPPIPPSRDQETTKANSSKRQFHQTPARKADASIDTSSTSTTTATGGISSRFITTFEVTVSKIFPAGFGWQTASVVADGMGMDAASANFALTTGLGDAIGVLAGHCVYYGLKKQTVDGSIDMTKELHTGVLLASAAFCSGTVWQPVVNALQGAGCSFNEVFAGTFAACGMAFYGGLRLGRTILPLSTIERPTFENSCTDAALSTAIGGATGFFVGTDAAYLPDQNFLIDIVGIADGTPDITGAAIAGTSTSLGFCTVQSGLNVTYPKGTCWND